MARPKNCKMIESGFVSKKFKPEKASKGEVELTFDELEALKLADYLAKSHVESADEMRVSRATFGRIIEKARYKLADAVLNNKVLKIKSGESCCQKELFINCPKTGKCIKDKYLNNINKEFLMDSKNFKAVFVTNDGETISAHFGPSRGYMIVEVRSGEVIEKKLIEKPNFHQGNPGGEHHEHGDHNCGGPESQNKHNAMLEPIKDCDCLVVGGMGQGMYSHLANYKIEPILSECLTIDEGIALLIAGNLTNDTRLVH